MEKSGSGFAFPSTTAYIARDSGLDSEKASLAAEEVRQWIGSGRIPIPATPIAHDAAVPGAMEYPGRS